MRRATVSVTSIETCSKQKNLLGALAEGYIKKGIQQGLRPEFAIWCGLHEDDPRERAKQFSKFTPPPNWYKHSPMYYVDEVFTSEYAHLNLLWVKKLKADGIVKGTEQGDILAEHQDETGPSDSARELDGARAENRDPMVA